MAKPLFRSPLKHIQYLSLLGLDKIELVELCMEMSSELGAKASKHIENKINRAEAKKNRFTLTVVQKVREVYLDLLKKGEPSPQKMEIELCRRFPEKIWVFDRDAPRSKGEQGFYRQLLKIKQDLKSLNK
jgi:hypothetical protein